jgi:hypothetical protein
MSSIKLEAYGSSANALTTELDALANGSYTNGSAAIDNTSNLYLLEDLELTVTFGSSPTDKAPVEVYLLPSIDGTNYADGSSSVTPARSLFVGSFLVRNTTSAQRLLLRGVPLPPGKYKYMVKNGTGQAFPASGSVIKRIPYNHQVS